MDAGQALAQAPNPRKCVSDVMLDAMTKSFADWSIGEIDSTTLVRRMERSCFNHTITECKSNGIFCGFTDRLFTEIYSTITSKVIYHLDDKALGTHLIPGLANGTIDPYDVGSMTSEQLCPTANKDIRDAIQLRSIQKAELKVSRAHTCRKCGKNETVFTEYIGCSADEGMKKSIKCLVCSNVWRG